MVREGRAAVVYRRHRHGLSVTRAKKYSRSTPNLSFCAVTVSFKHDEFAPPTTTTFCSVYRSATSIPPQHSIDETAEWLRVTIADFADGSRSLVIGGDFNACHPSWAGSLMPPRHDSRTATGELIHQIVSGHPHARILNSPGAVTRRPFGNSPASDHIRPSAIDITVAVNADWRWTSWVSTVERLESDHHLI